MEEQGPPAAGCLCSAPETTEKTLRKMEKTSLKVLLTLHILTFIRISVSLSEWDTQLVVAKHMHLNGLYQTPEFWGPTSRLFSLYTPLRQRAHIW